MPIRKTSKGWKIKNTHGVSPTKAHAKRRLKAIKARQGRKKYR